MTAGNRDEGFTDCSNCCSNSAAGDDVRAAEMAEATGLSEATCLAVLQGLERAGLMEHGEGDRFVRRTLDLMAS